MFLQKAQHLTGGGTRGSNHKGRVAQLQSFTEEMREGGREGGIGERLDGWCICIILSGERNRGREGEREAHVPQVGHPLDLGVVLWGGDGQDLDPLLHPAWVR